VRWDENYTYVNIPLACIATIILGAYSDRRGRKFPMVVGLLGMFLGNAIYMLVWYQPISLRLEFIYLAAFLDGSMGGFRLVMSSANAYLSDQYEVKRTVSFD
jgi:MFS family permease